MGFKCYLLPAFFGEILQKCWERSASSGMLRSKLRIAGGIVGTVGTIATIGIEHQTPITENRLLNTKYQIPITEYSTSPYNCIKSCRGFRPRD